MRRLLATAVLALGLLACTGDHRAPPEAKPAYLATSVSPTEDLNLQMRADGTILSSSPARYGPDGHALLPSWAPESVQSLALLEQPVAPLMGWGVTFMGEVASKARPLRYCLQERRAYDQQTGQQTAAMGERAIRAVFDVPFDVLPSVEDCSRADLVLGANAEQDCGSMGAWGCAALLYTGFRPYVRVTFNGTLLRQGQMSPPCVEYGIDWHEIKHAGDLGHTGDYGDEGRAHSHPSDLGYINGGTCRPVDNPGTVPAVEDWDDGTGKHRNRYGLRPRGAPPGPSPTPRPPKFAPPPEGSYERTYWDSGFNFAYCAFVSPANEGCH